MHVHSGTLRVQEDHQASRLKVPGGPVERWKHVETIDLK